MAEGKHSIEKIVSLAKRRGFVYQGSEIYGGLAGTWDYGPMGVELKRNIEDLWWRQFVSSREDMYGLDSSVVMPELVWRASGHLSNFTDPMVECQKCKRRFRSDHLENTETCLECKGKLGKEKTFSLLFPIEMGSSVGETSTSYLRGEIAQGMFVNFKNIIDSFHPRLPFGIAQIGKAFRNEIAPRDFLFRVREFDLMEFEYFIRQSEWQQHFEYWKEEMWKWIDSIGLSRGNVHELEVSAKDRAHYSERTVDFEYDFPFGRKELYGLAYRTDHDLKSHTDGSGIALSYTDPETGEKFIPHVIEPTFGLGRTILAILSESFSEDSLGGETRTYLKLKPEIAPIKVAVFPLLKNKPELVNRAREIYNEIKKDIPHASFDDNGNIGKRYRRQDEIGTPYCVTIDFDSLDGKGVTLRDRDTGEQKRIPDGGLLSHIKGLLSGEGVGL